MDIFIIREGRQTGPFSEEAVRAFLTEGSARPTDMSWCQGMTGWRALNEVLGFRHGQAGDAATQPPANPASNGTQEKQAAATAKQKVFLKYIGAEFGETLGKERAALAISDALENPKLQSRIRKWHDEKLRMHADVFQDEIDFRKANRSGRYLERVQIEGAEVVKDVTKAHVQVLVESLDKRHPGWESEPESALWDYLLPAVGEHFPQLVQPAYKGRLKSGTAGKAKTVQTRSIATTAGVVMPVVVTTGTLAAMSRGVILGVIALGAILAGHHFWQQSHRQVTSQTVATLTHPVAEKKKAPTATNISDISAPKKPTTPPPEKLLADAKAPATTPENPPTPAATNANEPATPATPAMNTDKPAASATPEEKPSAPATAPAVPAMTPNAPVTPATSVDPAATNTPPAIPPPQRNAVKLTQGIGVMLPNGQVTLPSGTILRFLAAEGPNVRVSWNNNVFFVPAMATDVNDPLPAPSEPAATPPTTGVQPAAPAVPAAKPKKPADDL
jgi:hypothetical protein